MGTYLSTPVVDKCEETGTDLNGHPGYARSSRPVNWGVVDMQGWRKSMEDAHIARTDVKPPALPPGVAGDPGGSTGKAGDEATTTTTGSDSDQPAISVAPPDEPGQIVSAIDDTQEPAKVFAVFDGHGGPEVARFCQLYLVDVLTSQMEWTNASLAEQDAAWPASTDMGSGEPQPSPLGSTAPNIGKALIESFHAMDRMIDDLSRREELTLLRSEKPRPGQHKSVTEGGGKPIPTKDGGTPCLADEAESEEEATDDDEAEKTTGVTGDDNGAAEEEQRAEEEEKKDKEDCVTTTGTRSADVEELSADDTSDEKDKETGKDTPALIVEESKDSAEDKEEETPGADADNVSTDADSTASVGGGDSIVNDGLDDDDDDDLDGGDDADGMISTADAVALFQKLLTMSGSSGTVELEVEGGEGGESDESGGNTTKSATATRVSDDGSGTPSQPATVTATTIGPNAAQPTRIQNGRQVRRRVCLVAILLLCFYNYMYLHVARYSTCTCTNGNHSFLSDCDSFGYRCAIFLTTQSMLDAHPLWQCWSVTR